MLSYKQIATEGNRMENYIYKSSHLHHIQLLTCAGTIAGTHTATNLLISHILPYIKYILKKIYLFSNYNDHPANPPHAPGCRNDCQSEVLY